MDERCWSCGSRGPFASEQGARQYTNTLPDEYICCRCVIRQVGSYDYQGALKDLLVMGFDNV